MKYNELEISKTRKSTRVGRGISAGRGKTAGRGTKGQKARAGSGKKEGFEGGQTPIMKRTPKTRGFRSIRIAPSVIYTGQLNAFKGAVTNQVLAEAGLVSDAYVKVKLIAQGDVTTKVDVVLQGASQAAIEMVQKAGGSFTKVQRQSREKSTKDK